MDCHATTAKSRSSDDIDQENKDVPKIKFKLSNGPSSSLNPMARVCIYCGKEFSNGKALGGHIRIHTQALKKKEVFKRKSGSRNEEETNCLDSTYEVSSSSSSDEEENPNKKMMVSSCIIDLLKDLPNWSRTDKRGRGSTCEAARNLISLASAGSSVRISETLTESTTLNKHDIIIDRKGKSLVLSSSSSSKDNGPPCRRIKFRCSTCGRVFPTFQALGGHRSSHNKDKTVIIPPPPPRTQTQSVSEASTEAVTTAAGEGGGPHRCDICRKNFPTGQALGGHKRCHWGVNIVTGSGSNNAKNSEMQDAEDEASEVGPDQGFRQDPMDIDLNKLPLMDVDELT